MDFRNPQIAGTFVYHCRQLEYEEGGMKGTIRVILLGTQSERWSSALRMPLKKNELSEVFVRPQPGP